MLHTTLIVTVSLFCVVSTQIESLSGVITASTTGLILSLVFSVSVWVSICHIQQNDVMNTDKMLIIIIIAKLKSSFSVCIQCISFPRWQYDSISQLNSCYPVIMSSDMWYVRNSCLAFGISGNASCVCRKIERIYRDRARSGLDK